MAPILMDTRTFSAFSFLKDSPDYVYDIDN